MTEKSYGLGIHTTTRELGLTISNFAKDSRVNVWKLDYELSNYLHEYLQKFIQPQNWSDLAFIAVAAGPGGFTGTRIGLVTARTLGQQLKIPVFAVSTLAAIAWSEKIEGKIAVKIPARRGEFFLGIYEKKGNELKTELNDCIMSPEKWAKILENRGKNCHIIEVEGDLGQTVKSLLEIAYFQWQNDENSPWYSALPFYGQHPVD